MSSNVYNIEDERRRQVNDKPLSATINEAKEEFKAFAETRIAMLQSEMRDKIAGIKAAAPMLVIGAVVGLTAWFVLTAALITVISAAFSPSPYAPFLGCIIVGVVYAVFGGAALMFGLSKIREQGVVPDRTIRVLKEDKVWLQNEARTQL
jgi:hypothetical protein